MAKHTCPNCGHVSTIAAKPKKPKGAQTAYQWAEVVFSDGVSILRGTYTGSKDHVAEGATYLRALSLSGGRFLDRAKLAKVPSVENVRWVEGDEINVVRDLAFDQREHPESGWGRNLTDLALMAPRQFVYRAGYGVNN